MKKKTGRPSIDWKNLPYEEYPLENLLGKRSRTWSWIKGREEKIGRVDEDIEELQKKINKLESSKYPHQRQIHEWERDVKLMNVVINQKSKLTDKGNESITLVKEEKIIRGKVSYFGKPVWCHIGSLHKNGNVHSDKLIGKMSDDELCDEFRYKLSMKIKSSKMGDSFRVLPKKEMDKRKGVVLQHPVTKQVKKVTSKRLDELDKIKRKKEEQKNKGVPEHLKRKK
tara:strand:+ start:1943 stop:2620 length:678 start_codon:yes stop_codon:yes gene_type:complete